MPLVALLTSAHNASQL